MSTRPKLYLYIVGVTLLVMLAIGIAIGTFAIGPAMAAPVAARPIDAEAEYHRGIYDICRSVLNGSPDQCLEAVAAARSAHWYEQDSTGWKWPVEARASR